MEIRSGSPFLFLIGIGWELQKRWKTVVNPRTKKIVTNFCLILGTFFNPFGFDVLFAMVMNWTGSYWATVFIFYFLSALFFGLYFLLSDKKPNPKKWIKKI